MKGGNKRPMKGDEQLYFEDLKVSDRFSSPSRTLTDAHFLFFAGLTGDNHPIHYDEEYARKTRFGARVAHGLLVMAMTAVGASPLSHRLEASMVAFVEQRCRFLKPVFIGDAVYPVFEVVALEPKGEQGLLRLGVKIRNQRSEVVLEGHHLYLLRCRPQAESAG